MNITLRVSTPNGSLIVKQAPPYCAKFPHIEAPEERIFAEAKFYDLANHEHGAATQAPTAINPTSAPGVSQALSQTMSQTMVPQTLQQAFPQVHHLDKQQHILVMQDLGVTSDYEWLYTHTDDQRHLPDEHLAELVHILDALHQARWPADAFPNHAMRALNHAYIFELPFNDQRSAINLDSITQGLTALGLQYANDTELAHAAQTLGHVYLHEGNRLLHGDYYPRSWLGTEHGLRIIDPEFGFIGQHEFELGVLLAHLALCQRAKRGYAAIQQHYHNAYDSTLLAQFTGIEILRRLLFISQLPVVADLSVKQHWLSVARNLVVTGDARLLHELS